MQPKPQSLRDLREYPILYVDDEPENLRIFELTFQRDFEIFTAESGDAGLEIINTKPVALVLSDHRMPGMTGTEFLSRVCEIDPKTIRIMVTAYGDAETLRDAINDGSIYHFIPKPWEPDDVRATLLRAIEAYALDRERAQLLLELMVLNRVSCDLNGELESGRVLSVLTRSLRNDLRFDGASVLVCEGPGAPLREAIPPAARRAQGPKASGLTLDRESAPDLYAALESGRSQTLRLDQSTYYPDAVKRWVTEVAAEEILITPLHGKDGLIGAVSVDNRKGGECFSGDDGTLVEGLCNQAAIAIENARLVGELRNSHEQLRRSERLGTLGTLAAGLAHEISNPLSTIQAFLSRAPNQRSGPESEGFWADDYALTCREADRISDLVGTLRQLGRGGAQSSPAETFDPADVCREVVTLFRREAKLAGVTLTMASEPTAPKLLAVRDQIHQVVLNLVQNALAVTPAAGFVRVEARAAAAGEGLEIEVSDSGPGIPAEHLEQIFDPFFTTKIGDECAGLGLMICQRIVADHGGTLEVGRNGAEGASFVVRLPLEKARPGA